MGRKLSVALNVTFGTLKILLAILMILAGIETMFMPLSPMDGALGYIFSTRLTLVVLGLIFSGSGTALLYGKIMRKRELVGHALLAIYACFMFAALINGIALDWEVGAWMGNFVASLVTGGLWLWWKYKVRLLEYSELKAEAKRLGIRP